MPIAPTVIPPRLPPPPPTQVRAPAESEQGEFYIIFLIDVPQK